MDGDKVSESKGITPEKLAGKGTEEAHQQALFCMCAMNLKKYPELRWFHAIPNGGARGDSVRSNMIRGAQLKASGVKPGICDTFLPVKRGQWSGLYIEMKKPGHLKNTSKEQKEYIDFVRSQGYAALVCDNWSDAWQALELYLNWGN
jgi:hypothetical protein